MKHGKKKNLWELKIFVQEILQNHARYFPRTKEKEVENWEEHIRKLKDQNRKSKCVIEILAVFPHQVGVQLTVPPGHKTFKTKRFLAK